MTTLLWTGVIGHRAIWLTCGVYVFVSNGCPKFTLKGVGIMSTPMVRTEGKTIKALPSEHFAESSILIFTPLHTPSPSN